MESYLHIRCSHTFIDETAKMTGISDSTIDRINKSLKEKGVIERKGQKNNSKWVVKLQH